MRSICFVASVACASAGLVARPVSAGPAIQTVDPSSAIDAGVTIGTRRLSIVSFGAAGSAEISLPDPALFSRLFDDSGSSDLPGPGPGLDDGPGSGIAGRDGLMVLDSFTPPVPLVPPELPDIPEPLEVPEPASLGLLALGLAIIGRRWRH